MKSVQPSENASHDRASAPPVFADYAGLYDRLYEDKDYEKECDFLVSIFDRFPHIGVDTVLDMGCGTGGHALPLAARGYKVIGVDRSEQMLAVAEQKTKASASGKTLSFIKGDIRNLHLNKRFDSVICMFSVLSYQTSNDDVLSTLKTARRHLKKGGVFVSDFWYGPTALVDKPANRLKEIRSGAVQVIRVAKPEMDVHHNLIQVHYTTLHIQNNQLLEKIEETHSMRYFFLPELTFFLGQADFKLVHTCPFGRIDDSIDTDTWNVTVIAQAI